MDGARVASGKKSSDGMHDCQRRRARRHGEDNCGSRPRGQRRDDARDVLALIVDEAVHRDDVVEFAKRRIEHIADRKGRRASARADGRSFSRESDQSRRDIDPDDRRAPLGELERERACPAAGVENASPPKVERQPIEKSSRALRRARRARSRGRG